MRKIITATMILMLICQTVSADTGRYVNIGSVEFVQWNGRPLVMARPDTIARVRMQVENITDAPMTVQLTLSLYDLEGTLRQAQTSQYVLLPDVDMWVTRGMWVTNVGYLVVELRQVKDGYTSLLSGTYVLK